MQSATVGGWGGEPNDNSIRFNLAMLRSLIISGGFWVLLMAGGTTVSAAVTFSSLLGEMVDRGHLARFPDPEYECLQASSYDRGTKSPGSPGWFANSDHSHYLRSEQNDGREEWVMMDVEGPGAVVRIWITSGAYRGTIRFYLDGATEPVIEAKIDELVGGEALVGAPLSAPRANGRNFYLPIPFARGCKITFDRPNFYESKDRNDLLYYQINYRRYGDGTPVESFSPGVFAAARDQVGAVQETLLEPDRVHPDGAVGWAPVSKVLFPGATLARKFEGPEALSRVRLRLKAEDLTQALRSTVLKAQFDGEETLWAPVGDFFGSGIGLNPFRGWYRQVDKDGWMTCYWVMPYENEAVLELENLGEQRVHASLVTETADWEWNDRSMHFHATWRQERNIETGRSGSRAFDWNYLAVNGQGVYVGDTLEIQNHHPAWWGEGDEKIYVDGEEFPSHIGTGTEDYYGYAWCTPEFFEAPFHAQPRAEGPGNFGHATNTRTRSLDAIPFHQDFRFDMEVWHWVATQIHYAVATYWYGRPGATANHLPDPEAARIPVTRNTQLKDFAGFTILEHTGGNLQIQGMGGFPDAQWSNDDQLWWIDGKPGDRLRLEIAVPNRGEYSLSGIFTKAVDYGIFQFYLDGQKLGEPVDLYNPTVIRSEPIRLGMAPLEPGKHTLTVEVVGANKKAVSRHMLGIDEILLQQR